MRRPQLVTSASTRQDYEIKPAERSDSMTYATHTSHDIPLLKHTRWLLLLMFTTAFALALACGSSDSSDDAAAPASGGEVVDDALSEVSITMLADQSFTFEDYVAAGWKKNKQFPTDTVPDATDIWYGFFSAKDIEIRF